MNKKKKSVIWIIGMIILLISCKEKPPVTTIHVELKDLNIDSVAYYVSRDGIGAYPIWGWNRIGLDSLGSAVIKIENPVLNLILIQPATSGFSRTASLFILPGDKYTVTLSTSDSIPLVIIGKDAKVQLFLNDFDYRFRRKYQTGHGDFDQLYSDTDPETILDHFELRMQPDLQKLEAIGKPGDINEIRYKAIIDHVTFTYLKELLSILRQRSYQRETSSLGHYQHVISYPVNIREKAYQDLLAELFKMYPYNLKYFMVNQNYIELLDSYLWYKSLGDSLPVSSQDEELIVAEKYLEPALYELCFASEFGKVSLKEPFSAVERRYDQFKRRFPDSKYLPGINKLLPRLHEIYSRYSPPDISPDTVR
ncbi:MAG: hypothetical protein GXO83_08870 [Chlorobi bacterium]|nr:hypothetical protein [Chlorobiota bacterium]